MKNQITEINKIKNKTIIDFKKDGNELWLKFSDDTFTILVNRDITEGYSYQRNEITVDDFHRDETEHFLVDLGFISEKAHKDACIKNDFEFQKKYEEREKQEIERIKNDELEQLHKLKSKYNI